MWHDFGFGGMWFAWLIFAIVIGLIVYLIAKVAAQNRGDNDHRSGETPLDILKQRYARGEISREEFLQIKKDLT